MLKKRNINISKLLDKNPDLKLQHENYNINVTANYGKILTKDQLADKMRAFSGSNEPAHLYFHVPYCNYICKFCNYVKTLVPRSSAKEEEKLDQVADALIEESSRYLELFPWATSSKIESIYLGGGTAALLKSYQLEKILKHARGKYTLNSGVEICIEGNPDNYLGDEVKKASDLGINRFSVGIQSLDDRVLKYTGRDHSVEMSIKSIHNLLKSGHPFNVDYMFGLPFQTPESVEQDMQKLLDLGVPTITIYRLRNANREKMGIGNKSVWNNDKIRSKMQEQGLFPTIYETYEMREKIVELFLKYNYSSSPCGWWSKPGTYKDGNIPQFSKNKWENFDSMLAFGPGAYGWLSGPRNEIIQTHNTTNINDYFKEMTSTEKKIPLAYGRELIGAQALATRLGFNFKSRQPIVLKRYKDIFDVDLLNDPISSKVIAELIEKDFLELSGNNLIVTMKGEALHEEVISVKIHGGIGKMTEQVCKKF